MALCIQSALRRALVRGLREFSTATETAPIQEEKFLICRTLENDPSKHTSAHLSRFYTIPPEDHSVLFSQPALSSEWKKQIKTFAEMSIMVREPAVEIISCLQQTDYKKPANKYVIYGKYGAGKTSTLMHLIHYGYTTNKLLVHVPWCLNWYRSPKEVANSTTKEGFLNLPIDASSWLFHFKQQNTKKLTDLKLTKSYEWSQRESTPEGAPFLELVDLGINRIRYASDIIVALMEEIKAASTAGFCNTLVIIDGFNSFLVDCTNIKNDLKQLVPASKITLTEAFMNITKYDWCNGAIVLSVDERSSRYMRESHLPRYLLGKEGFEHLDPFVPIGVENYNNDEFEMLIEYYKNRKWIRTISDESMKELQLISNSNPGSLMEYCKAL